MLQTTLEIELHFGEEPPIDLRRVTHVETDCATPHLGHDNRGLVVDQIGQRRVPPGPLCKIDGPPTRESAETREDLTAMITVLAMIDGNWDDQSCSRLFHGKRSPP
jgi:hypothetical protein